MEVTLHISKDPAPLFTFSPVTSAKALLTSLAKNREREGEWYMSYY